MGTTQSLNATDLALDAGADSVFFYDQLQIVLRKKLTRHPIV